ncbi:MAG: hypothetical protein Q7U80_15650 [Thiobacillus sp.]|nr:hypothetical protein [Thiobacillus sp.]
MTIKIPIARYMRSRTSIQQQACHSLFIDKTLLIEWLTQDSPLSQLRQSVKAAEENCREDYSGKQRGRSGARSAHLT